MRTSGDAPVTISHLSKPADFRSELAADVMSGLTSTPKAIPSKYFYDALGSELFEQITLQPEYYLTNAEREIIETHADAFMRIAKPKELVEIGSGSSIKTRLLIDAMHRAGSGQRYVPIDISEDALTAAAQELCGDYLWLEISALVGDFHSDLPKAPRSGTRLVAFLGSTIGNLRAHERAEFLTEVRSMLEPGDHFLLGVDLVKDADTLIAAYDDAAGVTAAFTRNILAVLNRELDANFDIAAFTHRPVWNPTDACMEAWLEAERDMSVSIAALGLNVEVQSGERIHTEVSCKFTREAVTAMFAGSGMEVDGWFTDSAERFAMVLARPKL